jgi:hypothetical protein
LSRGEWAVRAVLAVALLVVAVAAAANWLEPDPSFREAQLMVRFATRDTIGHPDDPGRLDSLGVALLRVARLAEAETVLTRCLRLRPEDPEARAGLGKLALFHDHVDLAESLLAGASKSDPEAMNDLLAARVRAGDYAGAAALAPDVGQEGRVPLLERLAERAPYQIMGQRKDVSLPWASTYPVPLVKVKLNGQGVVMALDTGASDLILDESMARRCNVTQLKSRRLEFWSGARIAVGNAMVQKLEIGGLTIEQVPAGTLSLRKWSLDVYPRSETVAGIIGLNLMRRFTTTLDFKDYRLELRAPDAAPKPGVEVMRVPFQIWGESELTVYGTMSGGRRMAFVVQTGVPGCGVGAPSEVFDEIGIKAGMVSRMVKGAGKYLHGKPWAAATVPSVTVGPMVVDKVPAWIGALDSSELWHHGVRRDALISNDFFRGYRVTIDWKAHELLIED